ncbi:DUF192 domain-containing protein [Alloalcanivorax mobilis]|uniref:DUF192 domain-containing protein n=1 Tax=Alloalcanivorax mobilis TaxID=2019569 RepID=UPI000B5B3D44|nr:DUF192 domain-containing protein [Alloalcanivorax mobilis]ASK33714.1 hypothetical protein CEK62_04575 [Alcanivorax sp. N3-2A]|tara:strand:+ start:6393 stop:6902 length:510 start_codon:yes stop_codon:yes gene_type:complete
MKKDENPSVCKRLALTGVLLMVVSGALAGPVAAPMKTVSLCVQGVQKTVRAEVAASEAQRNLGLMNRRELAPYAGMLFQFAEPPPVGVGFYMYRTLIPLDVAFMNKSGRIVAIRTMVPCASSVPSRCPVYRPGVGFASALEVNAGFFKRHDVQKGDSIFPVEQEGCKDH